MTDQARLAALEAVAEAAREYRRTSKAIDEPWSVFLAAEKKFFDLLDAIPEPDPQPAGKVVTLALWQVHHGDNDGLVVLAPTHLALDEAARLGTVKLTVERGE